MMEAAGSERGYRAMGRGGNVQDGGANQSSLNSIINYRKQSMDQDGDLMKKGSPRYKNAAPPKLTKYYASSGDNQRKGRASEANAVVGEQ